MSRTQLLRLGLFQMMVGGLSVLFLGVLNRVMRVELGLDLFLVTLLVGGGYYIGALVAIPFGYFSDNHLFIGYRRTGYILAGMFVTVLVLVTSPWMAVWLANSPTAINVILAFLFFLLLGIATYVAGTAYLSLITDRTSSAERGQATGLIWTMLMVGIIATGISTGIFMRDYAFNNLVLLFVIGGGLAILVSLFALWKQEPRSSDLTPHKRGSLRQGLRLIAQHRDSRAFAAFLLLAHFSFFMQDAILEPFGGELFHLNLAETTRFNAYMGVGLVGAMLFGGLWLIPRQGKKWVTAAGCWIMIVAFAGLSVSSFWQAAVALPAIIILLGLGAGFYTVGGISLMMDMTIKQHTGLFVGAWTLVQAFAKGPSAIVGGGLYSLLSAQGVSASSAYGTLFLLEGIGVLTAVILLRQVTTERFQQEAVTLGSLSAEILN